ncbi:MAG: hypothetical protein M1817_005847 [Caeruleum heppii]|nr:MAG: hypothetical protein M1817_005847 [Caeruleum heppii]
MAPLTVLSDPNILTLLNSLTRADVHTLQSALADALHTYSTGSEDDSACAANQPARIALCSKSGDDDIKTLFMPAKAEGGIGVKIVTLTADKEGHGDGGESSGSIKSALFTSTLVSRSSTGTTSSSSGTGRSTPTSSNPPSFSRSSTASTTASTNTNTSVASNPSTSPHGTLTLLTPTGHPLALISAATLTAFRTALASTLLFRRRDRVKTLTVFGAGKQAYWHVRLALLLRGDEIKRVNVVNRSFERGMALLGDFFCTKTDTFNKDDPDHHDEDDDADGDISPSRSPARSPPASSKQRTCPFSAPHWRPPTTTFRLLTPSHVDYSIHLRDTIQKSDVIFTCTASTTALFPPTHLTSATGRQRGRYIAAVGSYTPAMMEIPPDVLRKTVGADHVHHGRDVEDSKKSPDDSKPAHPHRHIHYHKHPEQPASSASSVSSGGSGGGGHKGVIVVDSVTSCLAEAGEIISARLKPAQLVELGELVMLKRMAEQRHSSSSSSTSSSTPSHHSSFPSLHHAPKPHDAEPVDREENDDGLRRWLARGNVVYKSVGLGLMDVVVGRELVRLAGERGVGVRVDGF